MISDERKLTEGREELNVWDISQANYVQKIK